MEVRGLFPFEVGANELNRPPHQPYAHAAGGAG
jgi:hypothetical protein